jgi:hypothetical protein
MNSALGIRRNSSSGRGDGGGAVGDAATDGVDPPVEDPVGVALSPDAVEGVGDADGDSEPPGSMPCEIAIRRAPTMATTTTAENGTARRGRRGGGVVGGRAPDVAPGSGAGPSDGVGILIVGLSSDMWATVYERMPATLLVRLDRPSERCTHAPPVG